MPELIEQKSICVDRAFCLECGYEEVQSHKGECFDFNCDEQVLNVIIESIE